MIFPATKENTGRKSIVLLDLPDCLCLIRHGLAFRGGGAAVEPSSSVPRVSLQSPLLPIRAARGSRCSDLRKCKEKLGIEKILFIHFFFSRDLGRTATSWLPS